MKAKVLASTQQVAVVLLVCLNFLLPTPATTNNQDTLSTPDAPIWRLSMSRTRCPNPPGGCYWYCQSSIVNECTWAWPGDCFDCETGEQR
jgi:hypothetical protein